MCLAIPMKIIKISGKNGIVQAGNVQYNISLELIDKPVINDYVIVHAGFAISRLNENEAAESLNLFKEMEDISDA